MHSVALTLNFVCFLLLAVISCIVELIMAIHKMIEHYDWRTRNSYLQNGLCCVLRIIGWFSFKIRGIGRLTSACLNQLKHHHPGQCPGTTTWLVTPDRHSYDESWGAKDCPLQLFNLLRWNHLSTHTWFQISSCSIYPVPFPEHACRCTNIICQILVWSRFR